MPLSTLPQIASLSNRYAENSSQCQRLSVAGLFAGIGGIEIGFHQAGHSTQLLCEIDSAATAVLNARFAGIDVWPDVTTLNALPNTCDTVVAGFPCQDLSQAGKTAGLEGKNSGLIHYVLALIKGADIRWLLLENVSFMLQLGGGRALHQIVEELEVQGFRWAYRVIDSRSFGVPQRRQRIYLLASRDEDPTTILFRDDAGAPHVAAGYEPASYGFYWTEGTRGLGWADNAIPTLKGGSTIGIPSSPAILTPDGIIGTMQIEDAERIQGFSAGWTQPAESVVRASYRWKLIGNAVTVGAARYLGELLAKPPSEAEFIFKPLTANRWPRAAYGDRSGRFEVSISPFPVAWNYTPIIQFLHHPLKPLSEKATAGFLKRARASSLRFQPGFLDAVETHLSRVSKRLNAGYRTPNKSS